MVTSIYINQYIDLVWHEGKPTIFVNGKPFRQCFFLLASLDEKQQKETSSIDEMAMIKGARVLERKDPVLMNMSKQEILEAHASNLIGWVELDYNTNALHSNLAFPLLKELARAGDEKARRVLQFEIEDRLRADFEPTSIAIIETCADVMDETAWFITTRSRHVKVRKTIAECESNPVVLEKLVADPEVEIRSLVAWNHSTCPDTLEKLAFDPKSIVRLRVADNINTSSTTLAHLSSDPNDTIRWNVSRNPNTPVSVLTKLAVDPMSTVRGAVAKNPNTPSAVLEKLASDPEYDVRREVAKHPNTSPAAMEHLASDTDVYVRRMLASRTKTPSAVLEKLVSDTDVDVRWLVAENPKTLPTSLEKLLSDPEYTVRKQALQRMSGAQRSI